MSCDYNVIYIYIWLLRKRQPNFFFAFMGCAWLFFKYILSFLFSSLFVKESLFFIVCLILNSPCWPVFEALSPWWLISRVYPVYISRPVSFFFFKFFTSETLDACVCDASELYFHVSVTALGLELCMYLWIPPEMCLCSTPCTFFQRHCIGHYINYWHFWHKTHSLSGTKPWWGEM